MLYSNSEQLRFLWDLKSSKLKSVRHSYEDRLIILTWNKNARGGFISHAKQVFYAISWYLDVNAVQLHS